MSLIPKCRSWKKILKTLIVFLIWLNLTANIKGRRCGNTFEQGSTQALSLGSGRSKKGLRILQGVPRKQQQKKSTHFACAKSRKKIKDKIQNALERRFLSARFQFCAGKWLGSAWKSIRNHQKRKVNFFCNLIFCDFVISIKNYQELLL